MSGASNIQDTRPNGNSKEIDDQGAGQEGCRPEGDQGRTGQEGRQGAGQGRRAHETYQGRVQPDQ
ncbi:MAG: hypothetical protein OEU93_14365, partial [Rubrivivax sp.]|nr:hypothetical protein [Rubrivivax sp.]